MAFSTIPTAGLSTGGANFRNLIINGDMSIAQRGTSSTSSGYATVDRMNIARDSTITQSQESLSSSDSPYSLGFRKYLRVTNGTTSSGTGTYVGITQRIEAQNIATSGWNYTSTSSSITISFWARSSLAGTYYCTPRTEDGTSYHYAFPIVLTANTWTKITKTITGNSNLTINNDNGNGFSLRIWPHLGSDFTTSSHTANQWNAYSASDHSPDYSQNWRNTASATFDITGLQLEVGTSASDFEFLPYDVNLMRCYRYCVNIIKGNQEDGAANEPIAIGRINNADEFNGVYYLPTEMRANPSITVNNISGNFYVGAAGNGGLISTLSGGESLRKTVEINKSSMGLSLSAGDGAVILTANSNSILRAEAEL